MTRRFLTCTRVVVIARHNKWLVAKIHCHKDQKCFLENVSNLHIDLT